MFQSAKESLQKFDSPTQMSLIFLKLEPCATFKVLHRGHFILGLLFYSTKLPFLAYNTTFTVKQTNKSPLSITTNAINFSIN